MTVYNHQLSNEFPKYPVKFIFFGTFNPPGKEQVIIHYGRKRNQTWPTLSEIFQEDFDPNDQKIFEKLEKHGIACIDLILSVEVNQEDSDEILGKGYPDSALFKKSVKRNYIDIELIVEFLKVNEEAIPFSTWGAGSSFNKEFKELVNKIPRLVNLVSPSLAAKVPKGVKKKDFIKKDWKSKFSEIMGNANLGIIMDCDSSNLPKKSKDIILSSQNRNIRLTEDSKNIDQVWKKVKDLDGQFFTTIRGKQFKYSYKGNHIFILDRAQYRISKKDFESALKIKNAKGPGSYPEDMSGRSYVWAILERLKVLSS